MSGCVDLSAGTRQLNGFVRVATMPPPAPPAPRRPTDRPHKMFQSRELRKPVPGDQDVVYADSVDTLPNIYLFTFRITALARVIKVSREGMFVCAKIIIKVDLLLWG